MHCVKATMIDIGTILGRLEKTVPAGQGEWMACCPAHRDTNQSLRVHQETDGRIWFHCFAGCKEDEILSAMNLTWRDLRPEGVRRSRAYGLTVQEYADSKRLPSAWLRSEARLADGTYVFHTGGTCQGVKIPYFGLDGAPTVLRWRLCAAKNMGKDGRDTRFKWEAGSKGGLTLYGLWRLAGRLPLKGLFLVEGESDCHTLWHAGLDALGLPGAGTYSVAGDTELLRQCGQVTVIVEPDKGGKTLFDKMAPLAKEGVDVRFVLLGKDAKDASAAWLEKPDVAAFSQRMAAAASTALPPDKFAAPEEWSRKDGRARTSPENGAKGADGGASGGRPEADYVRACAAYSNSWWGPDGFHLRRWREQWYEWAWGKWSPMPDSEMEARAMSWLQTSPAAFECNVKPTKGALCNLLTGMASMQYAGTPYNYQIPCWLPNGESAMGFLPTANGIVDIEATGAALNSGAVPPPSMPLNPNLLATYCLPYPFDPTATCPTFDRYLEGCLPDADTRECALMMMGLLLVPDTSYNVAFFLVGPAGTGKTTFLDILQKLLGYENIAHIPLLDFLEKFELWPLGEKLANIVEELPVGDPLHKMAYIEGMFKASIGGGFIKAQHKHKDSVDMPCIARHVFAANALPKFFDKSEAIWHRLRIFPFERIFRYTSDDIPDMGLRLEAELPGILNKALAALARLRACGGVFPESAVMASRKALHRAVCDPDVEYFAESYELDPNSWVEQSAAYDHYCKWLESNGYSRRSSSTFTEAILRRFGIRATRMSQTDRRRVLKGLRLIYDYNETTGF